MKLLRFTRVAAAGLLLSLLASLHGHAQDFPNRPVTIVVPFAPGGAGDILARMIGQKLEQKWGKSVVVENKTGAGGVVGAIAVARSAADGHTLLIAPSATMAVNVTLFRTLPYDPTADFIPLALAAQTPFVLVVNPDLPVKTRARAHSVREGPGRTGLLRDLGRRRAASSLCRAVEKHDRHSDVAGDVSRQPAGAQ